MTVSCQPRHVAPQRRPAETAAERNFEAVWQASRSVLRSYGFPIDRQDRRAGVINTTAVPGGHLFEVWRPDAATIFHYRENTVQTILRAAEVTIRRGEQPDEYVASVRVRMARSNRPGANYSDPSQALGHKQGPPQMPLTFADLAEQPVGTDEPLPLDVIGGEPPRHRRKTYVPLGRDSDLEHRMERQIAEAAAKWSPTTQPAVTLGP